MNQNMNSIGAEIKAAPRVGASANLKLAGLVLFLALLQGIILFGPSTLGTWAHDNFHSYRHSVGMACH